MSTNPRDIKVFGSDGQPIEVDPDVTPSDSTDSTSTANLVEELMPYIKRRRGYAFIERELWERVEAWYGVQGLTPLTSETVMLAGLRNIVFLGVAWICIDDKPEDVNAVLGGLVVP
jgi:hypothetical protein